jgi:hypothetical protein
MQILSEPECQDWLNAKFARNFTQENMQETYPHCVTYLLPSDAGRKTAITRILIGSIDTTAPGLFWITSWGIFPSSENMALFDGYRKSLGESRGIGAAPGHVFGESDLQSLECLFDLTLYFYWDATLFDGAERIVVRTSHDEYISVHAKHKEHLEEFESKLARLKLKQLV